MAGKEPLVGATSSTLVETTSNDAAQRDAAPSITSVYARKKAPPASPSFVRNRFLIVASFWLVALVLGVPMWFYTTSIHRDTLPLDEMTRWSRGEEGGQISFPLTVVFELEQNAVQGSLTEDEGQELMKLTQRRLDDASEVFRNHHLRLSWGGVADGTSDEEHAIMGFNQAGKAQEVALRVRFHPEFDDNALSFYADVRPDSCVLDVHYAAPISHSGLANLAKGITGRLNGLYLGERGAIAYALSKSPAGQATLAKAATSGFDSFDGPLSPATKMKFDQHDSRSFKYAPTYHIAISLFSAGPTPSDWDIEAAMKEYLYPLLNAFPLSNFTVDTQVQLYATFSATMPQPQWNEERQVWALSMSSLGNFVNSAEWSLGPSIGSGPTVHLIMYVPLPGQTPLMVAETSGDSWIIPQWGAVTILNPPESSHTENHLSKNVLRPAMLNFGQQLLSLLGALDEHAHSLALRLRTLRRVQTVSLFLSASSTLGSLARLTASLPSIPIPPTVLNGVEFTMASLRRTTAALRDGDFETALIEARNAEQAAEKAFFEKSMVGQVYFPEEHKIAVYLPLLGPMAVPLVLSAIRELKRLRGVEV